MRKEKIGEPTIYKEQYEASNVTDLALNEIRSF